RGGGGRDPAGVSPAVLRDRERGPPRDPPARARAGRGGDRTVAGGAPRRAGGAGDAPARGAGPPGGDGPGKRRAAPRRGEGADRRYGRAGRPGSPAPPPPGGPAGADRMLRHQQLPGGRVRGLAGRRRGGTAEEERLPPVPDEIHGGSR